MKCYLNTIVMFFRSYWGLLRQLLVNLKQWFLLSFWKLSVLTVRACNFVLCVSLLLVESQDALYVVNLKSFIMIIVNITKSSFNPELHPRVVVWCFLISVQILIINTSIFENVTVVECLSNLQLN